jgi:3-hydroxyisobutyrate dehydrogenase
LGGVGIDAGNVGKAGVMSVTPKVAVLGLGTMGAAMARRISGAGLPTTVWNRSASRTEPFAAGPAVVAQDIAAAVAGADIVLTMLFDAEAVQAVLAVALPAMRSQAILMQCSTVGVEAAERFATAAAAEGVGFVDAPVLGTKAPAEAGTLTALLAGPDALLAAVAPVVAAIATRTVRAGDAAPAGSALKLAMNAWIATITAGIAQSLTIADQLGLDPALVLEALLGAAADSPYAQLKGAAMLQQRFDAQFEVVGLLKDVRLARAATPGMPQPLLAALDELYAAAADGGAAHADIAAVWQAFQA